MSPKATAVLEADIGLLDVHESVHRDTTMKITNRMHYIRGIYIYIYLYLLTAVGLSPGGSTHLHTNNR